MNIAKIKLYLNRPEYIFRPTQIYQRISNTKSNLSNRYKYVVLPWGLQIKIPTDTNDVVGKAISTYGIYDLSLTEVIWRLISPGETVIDIGANIGYITSIMAKRVGKTGKVWCFEPNPEVYAELNENIKNWQRNLGWNHINPQEIALSDHAGSGILNITLKNRGESFINNDINNATSNLLINSCSVSMQRLDKILEKTEKNIGVLKIDVEGYELPVLQGAGELISQHNIRDILFEEHGAYPSPVTQYLEANGYTIFRIWKGFWKPLLVSPEKNLMHHWEPPNYLATCDPARVTQLMKEWDWKSLRGK
jgi:FkbM family methyltransferase